MDLSKLNEEQKEAVLQTEGPVLIIAGAGSGKTTCLTNRLVNIIEKGVDPHRILLLTFTNKAAREMTERAKTILDNRCEDVNGTTYHSFCAEILRRYACEIGFTSNFTICDSSDAAEIINLIKEKNGYTKELGLPDGKALVDIFSYMLNKEKTLLYVLQNRYPSCEDLEIEISKIKEDYTLYKYENNILDYDDLLTQTINLFETYPNLCKKISDYYQYIMVDEYQDSNLLQMQLLKLLRQFENKNICVVGDPQQCFPIGTKVSTLNGIKNIEELEINDKVKVASGHGETNIGKIENIYKKKYNGDLIKITTASGNIITATPEHTALVNNNLNNKYNNDTLYLTMFNSNKKSSESNYKGFKHEIYLNEKLIKTSSNIDELNDFLKKYKEEKIIDNAILTNELTNFTFMPFSDIKKGMKIGLLNNEKIITDEIINVETIIYNGYVYDLNIPYYRNYIVNNIVVHNCIYGFRGSLHENILNFPDMFDDCKIIKLHQNYRSNQEILDLSNSITETIDEKFKNPLKGTHHCGFKPKLIKVNGQNDEALYVINQINKFRREGVSLNDMAVLIRGSYDSNMLESLIMEQTGSRSIEYQKFGGIKFFERDFVKNIFAFLKILINYKDEISWFRILKLYPGIGPVNAKKITEDILKNGTIELDDPKYTKKKFAEYLPEIHQYINDMNKMEFQEQMEYLINDYYYNTIKRSIKNMKTTPANIKKKLKELDDEIMQAQVLIKISENYKTVNKFINDLLLEVPPENIDDEKLTISTIHSIKGLEFKIVFVLGCIEGKFPWVKEPRAATEEAFEECQNEMEEERRVFYVAITRAKDHLFLMYPQYNIFTREKTTLSRFLAENNRYTTYCDIDICY